MSFIYWFRFVYHLTRFMRKQTHPPVAFMKSPLGASFLQLLMAVESPLLDDETGCISMVVHTQSFSKNAPPDVWALATSYQRPLYLSFWKPIATGGDMQELPPTMNALLRPRRQICKSGKVIYIY